MKHSLRRYDICVYTAFAFFYLWMAAQIPYTHDDWDWGLPIGIQQLVTASLNGRYVGNFFEVVMTRSEILKTIIMGAGFFLLPFIISRVVFQSTEKDTRNESVIGFLLCNVLVLSMSRSIWQQTYGWIAGYSNFGISSIFLIIIMGRFLHVFDDVSSESREFRPRSVGMFLICLAGQLFIENVSIYVFLSSVVINYIYWHKTKHFSCEYILIFLAALIGLVLIFSSNLYQTLWTTGKAVNGYRQLFLNSETDIRTFIGRCFQQIILMPPKIYANNLSICMAIIILMSILLMQMKAAGNSLRKVCCLANGFVAACLVLSQHLGIPVSRITSVLFFVTITAEVIMLFKKEKTLLCKMLFVWISPVCIILPLACTSELGDRLFLTSNSVLILFTVFLLRFCLRSKKKMCYAVIVFGLAVVLLFHYGIVYYAIGECKDQRDTSIKNAIKTEADTIYLTQYPYLEYLWGPNPTSPAREALFKEFYEIPQNVSIVVD